MTAFKHELIDRFGRIPEEVKHLLRVREWQFKADKLGFSSMKSGKSFLTIALGDVPQLNIKKLIHLIQTQPEKFQLKQKTKLLCRLEGVNLIKEIDNVLAKLEDIA